MSETDRAELAILKAWAEQLWWIGQNPSTHVLAMASIAAEALAAPAAPEAPSVERLRLLDERYWCGCVRYARWERCSLHGALDHDEEPEPTLPLVEGPGSEGKEVERRELLCEICGREHAIWHAPNDLWNAVMRGGDRAKPDEFEFVCPTCFMALAAERSICDAFEVRPNPVIYEIEASGADHHDAGTGET